MVDSNSFFASVSEGETDYALEMLNKKMPELLNDKLVRGEVTDEEYWNI
jgi:N-dimethylarginine dimethylaminohydrolase